MKTLLVVNLSTKTAFAGDEAWVPPTLYFGEELTLGLRLVEGVLGALVENDADIVAIAASIGAEDARAESGQWALQIGSGAQTSGNTTDPLDHDCTAAALKAAIAAKTAVTTAYGAPSVTKVDGSWLIVMGSGGAQVPMQVRDNTLFPISRGRITAAPVDGVWQHEVRLQQIPVANTDVGERVLPPEPTVMRLVTGSTGGGYRINELQRLYVPPQFRATYQLRDGAVSPAWRTAKLSQADTAETIQAALEAQLGAGNVVVTNPAQFSFDLEFTGDLKGTTVDELDVVSLDPPPGDLTFTLALDRAPLLDNLRRAPFVTLPLEVRVQMTDEDDVDRWRVAFRRDVTIRRPIVWPEWATAPELDLLRPPSPIDYVPRSTSTVFTGDKSAAYVRGNGSATVFDIAHVFATQDVVIAAKQNTTNGRQLIDGTDFTALIIDNGNVRVTSLTGAPATNAWVIYVRAMAPVAAFAGHTHTIGDVTGLEDRLDAIETSLGSLVALTAVSPIGTTTVKGATPIGIVMPARVEVYPGTGTPSAPPRPRGGLLPAVHDASVTSVTTTLPDATANAGNVIQNNTGAALLLPGKLYWRDRYIAVGEYAASDGRCWYPVTRSGATTSYFPRDFERTLRDFEINALMFRAGTSVQVNFEAALQLLNATCRARYLFVVEHGIAVGQTSPATTASNLSEVQWHATPLLSLPVILTDLLFPHRFGVEILRSSGGTISANKIIYGLKSAADSVPASANLALRSRLINFDTENSDLNALGAVHLALSETNATITT